MRLSPIGGPGATVSARTRIARTAARSTSRLPKRMLRRMAGAPVEIDGNTLDLQMQAFATAAAKQLAGQEPTPESIREGFAEMVQVTQHDPVATVSTHDRTIPGPPAISACGSTTRPARSGAAPAIVWYHQGGYVIGDLDSDHALCTTLADRCGAVVVSVDYRLAPEHPFPAFIDDGVAAHQWVVDHAEGLGVDPARVAVAGTSAGGMLAAVVCQQARLRGVPQPVAQILLYPGTDHTFEGGSRESCAETFPLTAAAARVLRPSRPARPERGDRCPGEPGSRHRTVGPGSRGGRDRGLRSDPRRRQCLRGGAPGGGGRASPIGARPRSLIPSRSSGASARRPAAPSTGSPTTWPRARRRLRCPRATRSTTSPSDCGPRSLDRELVAVSLPRLRGMDRLKPGDVV